MLSNKIFILKNSRIFRNKDLIIPIGIGSNKNNIIFNIQFYNFATKMRAGVTKNNKDSAGRRLGVKKFGGEEVIPGNILVRQRGFQWKEGENMYHGRDHTFHARKEGKVSFYRDPWSFRRRTHVNVIEQETPNRKVI
jgi:large subunit ribosomal protein L27